LQAIATVFLWAASAAADADCSAEVPVYAVYRFVSAVLINIKVASGCYVGEVSTTPNVQLPITS